MRQALGRGVRAVRRRKTRRRRTCRRAWRVRRQRRDRSSPRPCGSAGFRARRYRRPSCRATVAAAASPTQSAPNATGLPSSACSASATGFSESSASGPLFGRPKCESTMTLAPRLARSFRPGTRRSSRVASVTLPFLTGTLRSARTSTRLPFTSTTFSRLQLVEVHSVASFSYDRLPLNHVSPFAGDQSHRRRRSAPSVPSRCAGSHR